MGQHLIVDFALTRSQIVRWFRLTIGATSTLLSDFRVVNEVNAKLLVCLRKLTACATNTYFIHWPIFSVPNVPIPFSRNAKTIRFSLRNPTLKVKSCAVIAQHFQV